MKLSFEEKELLASLVKPHPALYSKSHPQYNDSELKRKLFYEVAMEFCEATQRRQSDENVTFLKRQWYIICDKFLVALAQKKASNNGFNILHHCSFLSDVPVEIPEPPVCEKPKKPRKTSATNRYCCVCGAKHDRTFFVLLSTVPERRQAWYKALGLPQPKIDTIEKAQANLLSQLPICRAHFPFGSFKNGKRAKTEVMPFKLEDTRSVQDVQEELRSYEKRHSSAKKSPKLEPGLICGQEIKTENDDGLPGAEKENEEKNREPVKRTTTESRSRKRIREYCEQYIRDNGMKLVKTEQESCSAEKYGRQISSLAISERWQAPVLQNPPNVANKADDLNDTMMTIMAGNIIDCGDGGDSSGDSNNSNINNNHNISWLSSSVDLLQDNKVADVRAPYHHNTDVDHESNKKYTVSDPSKEWHLMSL